ncbi:MAG: type III pantothenate kinase [Nitrospiraceae bacterium]|nr:type III pantothenate kinase [Nitrospiraceae bacterium]
MLLVIDVGNTNTVIGVYEASSLNGPEEARQRQADTGLTHHFRIATVEERTADEQALLMVQLLGMKGLDHLNSISGVVISSTVPSATQALREMVERWFGTTPLIIGPGVRSGMPILYDNPKEVGADRIADAVAGRDLYGIPLVVVDFGTATTFDAVSSRGEYLGGAICPGVEISMNALVASAAALRKVELTPPRGVIGRSTVESMQSGAIYGFGAQADGMVRAFRAELGPETKVVATGGLAAVIAPFCDQIDAVEPWLTLHGLRLLYERNILAR